MEQKHETKELAEFYNHLQGVYYGLAVFDQLKHSFHTPNNADVLLLLSTFVSTCHKILVLVRVLAHAHALASLMKTRLSLQILSNSSEQTNLSIVE